MYNQDATIYDSHHSKTTKYYGLLFLLIFAIPIGILLFLMLEGPLFFTVIMFSTLLGVYLVMAYFTFASSSLKYELSAKELRIRFGLINKKIAYSQISRVEKVQLSLSLRLFGASLPGFHWGFYRTSIGNAHVYGTRISGDYIVITLQNGEKIAISPQEPDRFLNAINEPRNDFGKIDLNLIKREEQTAKKYLYTQILSVALVYAVFLGYFFWVYASLPQIVPVHFGFDGIADRWAEKSELLWLAGIACVFPIINAVLSVKFGKHERGLLFLLGTIFVVSVALFFYAMSTIVASA
jgi:hypothetical protein